MENDSTVISNITNLSQGYNSEYYLVYSVLFLAVRFIVGVLGNVFVLLIYRIKITQKNTTEFYISVLAASDLTAVIILSVTSFVKGMKIYTKYILLCKTLSFISIFPAFFSVFLLLIIAFDRYQRICCKVSISSKWKWWIVIFELCIACLFALPSAVLSSNVRDPFNHSISTVLCEMPQKFRIQYGASIGISVICIIMLLVFLYGRIIQQIYNHFQVRNSRVWSISDTANIQINDDATTTSSPKVPEIKERTGLKCTITGTHRSQRHNLRMMKKIIVLLIVITATFFLSFIPSIVLYTVGVYEYDLSYLSEKKRIGVLISLYIYNIGCAVNPCIHMCIDSRFRRESKRFIIRKWRSIMKC